MDYFTRLYYYDGEFNRQESRTVSSDICIYGATSAGVVAAVQAKKQGLTVALVEFGSKVGGMTASGLGMTDIGNKQAIGGLALSFYEKIGRHYGLKEGQPQWTFEPHVAETVFLNWLDESDIHIYYRQPLSAVKKDGGKITELKTETGMTFHARIYVDATYEGDLFAKAGVSYHVGRESNSKYFETLNGIHYGHPNHNFKAWVDPYVIPGKPDSGLIKGVKAQEVGYQGQGDKCVQAYNFRICLTSDPDKRLPFPEPPGYDPEEFTLLARYIRAGVWDAMDLHKTMPNLKTDLNNYGAVSTDFIGENHNWPEGSYETREKIFQKHVNYNAGMLYFLANDDQVPEYVRKEVIQWGLPFDEFADTDHWPHQLYVREGRRMISDYVMSEHDCRGYRRAEDTIGLAAYQLDSHNCRRIVIENRCVNEGNVEIEPKEPFPISYRSIIPEKSECTNLIVPVCLSSTHIAYGSIRMEPVFMVLAQSAAEAAALALEKGCHLQDIEYSQLQERLMQENQKLEWR